MTCTTNWSCSCWNLSCYTSYIPKVTKPFCLFQMKYTQESTHDCIQLKLNLRMKRKKRAWNGIDSRILQFMGWKITFFYSSVLLKVMIIAMELQYVSFIFSIVALTASKYTKLMKPGNSMDHFHPTQIYLNFQNKYQFWKLQPPTLWLFFFCERSLKCQTPQTLAGYLKRGLCKMIKSVQLSFSS